MQRERAKRERVDEVHSNDVKQAVLQTERKNDKAWQKVCSTLQSQLVVLQTQLAQYELQRVRQQAQWDFTESNYKTTASALRTQVTVWHTRTLLPSFFYFMICYKFTLFTSIDIRRQRTRYHY